MHKLSIIIPCYNEERTVAQLLERVLGVELPPQWQKEIIVVDDASTDGTRDILRGFEPRLMVRYSERNGGKGTAVARGLSEATGDYVLIQDADLEYDPHDIPALLGPIDAGGARVVYGSRTLRPQQHVRPLLSSSGVWFLTKLVNVLYETKVTDVCTCYKLFPREAGPLFRTGGFESDILITAALARAGYLIVEVPIGYTPRTAAEGKKIRYRDGIRAIVLILKDWLTHA